MSLLIFVPKITDITFKLLTILIFICGLSLILFLFVEIKAKIVLIK